MEKLITTGTTYFVRNTKKIIDSLFTGGTSTAAGTFKALKGRVMFYDMQGNLFAALIVNSHSDAPFFVNACKLDNGKTFYQYATGTIQEQKLGIAGLGYIAGLDVAASVAKQAGLIREAA